MSLLKRTHNVKKKKTLNKDHGCHLIAAMNQVYDIQFQKKKETTMKDQEKIKSNLNQGAGQHGTKH